MPRPANPHLKRDLLVAATRLLDAAGEPTFTIKDLCAEVDYSVTAAYRAFRSRAHLLQALQLHLFEGLLAALVSEPAPTVVAEVRSVGRRFMAWADAHPARYRLMFQSIDAEVLLAPAEQELARAPLRYLEALLARGCATGALQNVDPRATAVMLFASLHGLISLHLAGRLDPSTVADPLSFYDQWADQWLATLSLAPDHGESQ